MKVKLNQKKLQQAVKQLQKVLAKKTTNPILAAVYFSLASDELILRVTDLSVGEEIKVKVEGNKEEITLLIPGKAMIEAVSMFSREETELTLSAEQMILKNGSDRVVLGVLQSDDFPEFKFKFEEMDKMPIALLKEIDQKMSFAVSTDISRPQLTGVYFNFTDNDLNLVTTDGFRLALLDTKNFSGKTDEHALVPMRAFKDVLSLAEAYESEEVEIYWESENGRVVWKTADFLYFTNLIENAFPPYERIVPLEFEKEVKIDREDLLLMLNKAQIFARESSNIVKMVFHDKELSLTAKGLNGQYEGELELLSEVKEEYKIAFNIKYLIDFLNVLKSKEIWWGMNENTKPVLLAEKSDSKYRYVVMPFKTVD